MNRARSILHSHSDADRHIRHRAELEPFQNVDSPSTGGFDARARVQVMGREAQEFIAFQQDPAQLPSGAVGKNGFLRLGFERREQRTILAQLERQTPLLAQKALYWDETMPDMACVFIIMTSGCVLGGDRLAFELSAAEGARAHVTTQGATKIHSMDANFAAQAQSIRVAAGAYMEFMPEAVIPHRRSRFLTETDIVIDPSGTLLYSEILMSGRKHHRPDESFGFDVFSSKVAASRPDRAPLFTERFIVQPSRQDVSQAGIMGPYEVFGNVLLLTPRQNADRIIELTGAEVTSSFACGVTRLPNDAGLIFKVLGMESHDVQKKIKEFWGVTREVIVGSKVNSWFWR